MSVRSVRFAVRAAAIGVATILLAGCSGVRPLATLTPPANWSCAGIGLDGTITGSPTDPRGAWFRSGQDAATIDLVVPAGYTARFLPALEILDVSGRVVMREGDHLSGGCAVGDGTILVTADDISEMTIAPCRDVSRRGPTARQSLRDYASLHDVPRIPIGVRCRMTLRAVQRSSGS